MRVPRLPDSMLPGDLQDSDFAFDLPSGEVDSERKTLKVTPPTTMMVWCIEGQHHWEDAITEEKWWTHETVKLCSEHSKLENVA